MRYRINIVRRVIGSALCLIPLAFPILSITLNGVENSGWFLASMVFSGLALLLGSFNFFLFFIRPLVHRMRGGKVEDYQFVSGLPVIGNLFALLAVALELGNVGVAIVGIVTAIIDTGGLPWFLLCTWKDQGLWDNEVSKGI